MRNRLLARYAAPALALAFCLGCIIGGSLPDLGNLAMYYIFGDTAHEVPHLFNRLFLVAGIVGIAVCGVACYRRLLHASSDRMVKK